MWHNIKKLNHSELKSFFIGTLLGDAYIHNGVFCCKQISKDLVEFKKQIIDSYLPKVKTRIIEHPAFIDKNGVNHQKCYELYVHRHRYISKLEKIFYPNGKKIYPKHYIKKLTPLGFAMWYADDGTTIIVQKGKNRRVQLCTDNFTREEHEQMKQDLQDLGYNIKIIDRARRNQVRLQFNVPYQKFICSISEYFYKYFPSLLYKMDLGYRGESLNSQYVSEEYKECYLKISAHPEFKDRLSDDIV